MQLPSHIQQTILETERLILKEVNPEIISYIYSQWSDADIMVYKGFPTAEFLAAEKEKLQGGGFTTYRIKLKGFLIVLKETHETVGACHYHTWQPTHARAEIGYAITKEEHKNKGYMKEALRSILEYGFNEMRLNRVEAMIGPENEASIRLIQRFGFIKEGVMREHYCKNGVVYDSVIFSLLRKEYQP